MKKLIITVTVDSTASYPNNPYCPPLEQVEEIAGEYVRAVEAGASIVHHHGIHKLEDAIQEDGRKLSRTDFDGWKRVTELIRKQCDAIIQFGIASARQEEKVRLRACYDLVVLQRFAAGAVEPLRQCIGSDPENAIFYAGAIYYITGRRELAMIWEYNIQPGGSPW